MNGPKHIIHVTPLLTLTTPPICATPGCGRWLYPGTLYCEACRQQQARVASDETYMPGWYDDAPGEGTQP